jgi:hypothetical protein
VGRWGMWMGSGRTGVGIHPLKIQMIPNRKIPERLPTRIIQRPSVIQVLFILLEIEDEARALFEVGRRGVWDAW